MSWGYKIIMVYAVFVAGILFMVFKSSSQKMDLVTEDYYAKELKYQQQIDETQRASTLSQSIKTEVKENQLFVYFPNEFAGKKISGQIELYFPADKYRDIVQHFSVSETIVSMAIPDKNKGLYELHLTWNADGVNYFFKEKISL
jgi:hypothetical protein